MTTQTHTNAQGVDIVPRHMGFEFPKDTPKYWFGGDPWATHLFNALSLTFPGGEGAFVTSVRNVRDRVKTPELQEEIRAFIAQEMHHSKEHEALNEWLKAHGVPVDSIYAQVQELIVDNRKGLSPEADVAITAALEHFTAIMAHAFLDNPGFLDAIHENVRWLWIWHAIEEAEHKAVAYDVYQEIGGTYRMRVLTMMYVTQHFIRNTARFHRQILRADGQENNLRSKAKFFLDFWGPRGHFTKLVPLYLQYYRPDFHPWQHDNRATLARWKSAVEARAKRIGPGSRTGASARAAA